MPMGHLFMYMKFMTQKAEYVKCFLQLHERNCKLFHNSLNLNFPEMLTEKNYYGRLLIAIQDMRMDVMKSILSDYHAMDRLRKSKSTPTPNNDLSLK